MASKPKYKCGGQLRMKKVVTASGQGAMKLQQWWHKTTKPLDGEWRDIPKVPINAPDNEYEFIEPTIETLKVGE